MPPPKIRLVKGFGTMSHQEPGELDTAIKRYLLTKQALDDDTLTHYSRALKVYQTVSPDWPPTIESLAAFVSHCKAKYQDNTTFSYFKVVKAFVAWLVKRKIIADNPLEDLAGPVKPDDLPRAPPAHQIKTLFSYLENQVERVLTKRKKYDYQGWREVRNLAIFSLLLDSGLRVSEAINVRLGDINLEGWSIFVRHAKRKKQRYVAIGRTARADIKLWLNYRSLIPMPDSSPGLDYLFLSRRRGWIPMSVFNVEDQLKRLCARCDISPAFTPHELRHAYVVYSLLKGGSIEEIRKQMGHSSLTTTARYARSLDDGRIDHHLKTSPRDFLF